MKRWFWWLLAAMALLGVACSFTSLLSSGEEGKQNTAPEALFQDDFSNPKSGWDRVSDDQGSLTDYVDGRYRIFVNDTQSDIWANPSKHFTGDIVVEVDAVKNSGPDDNDFGIICRYQDVDNYYAFLISSDGYAGIERLYQGRQEFLNSDKAMVPVDIPTGDGITYHLTASCIGNHLVLSVNGKRIMDATDDTFTEGDVGLIAGTFDEKGADILFDNFVVHRP